MRPQSGSKGLSSSKGMWQKREGASCNTPQVSWKPNDVAEKPERVITFTLIHLTDPETLERENTSPVRARRGLQTARQSHPEISSTWCTQEESLLCKGTVYWKGTSWDHWAPCDKAQMCKLEQINEQRMRDRIFSLVTDNQGKAKLWNALVAFLHLPFNIHWINRGRRDLTLGPPPFQGHTHQTEPPSPLLALLLLVPCVFLSWTPRGSASRRRLLALAGCLVHCAEMQVQTPSLCERDLESRSAAAQARWIYWSKKRGVSFQSWFFSDWILGLAQHDLCAQVILFRPILLQNRWSVVCSLLSMFKREPRGDYNYASAEGTQRLQRCPKLHLHS